MQKWLRYCKVKIEVLYSVLLILFDSLFHIFSLNIHIIWPINRTKWWIIKVKHPSSDIYRKNISLMKINNIILVLRTRIILLSSFVIYFFCICHSGRFPILFTLSSTCDVKACIFYGSYRVKNNGNSFKNLEKSDREWLNIPCNLVQTHLIFTEIELSYV